MSKQKTRTLQERIAQLEEQKNKLIAGRKEEIANAVLKAGGISIYNGLKKSDSKKSSFVSQMM